MKKTITLDKIEEIINNAFKEVNHTKKNPSAKDLYWEIQAHLEEERKK